MTEDVSEKTVPASVESEEAVLGSLIMDPDAYLEVVSILKPDDFYRERNGWIYRVILEMNEKREPVDFLTICDELERRTTQGEGDLLAAVGGAAYITQLVNNVPSAAYAAHYAERVLDTSLRRQMIVKATDLAAAAWDYSRSPRESVSDHISDMTGFSFNEKSEPSEVKECIGPLLDMVQNGGLPSVSTGYRELDRILRGGYKPGKLSIFAARPGVGKTAAMLNTMWRGCRDAKAPAAFFSLEMSKLELTGRLMSISGGVPNDVFNSPEVAATLKDSDWDALMQVASTLSSAPMILDDTPGIFLGDLYAKLRRLKARYGIKVAYIDYMQLVRVSESFQNRNLEVAHISSSLKRFALELEIQIVAASQLSRAVEGRTDNRPVLSDLRESGNIEQDADVVIFLYREDLVKPTTTRQNIVDAIVAKNRAGTTETAELYYRGSVLTFENIELLNVAEGVPSNQATTDVFTAASGADQWDQTDLLDGLVTD